jgi:hypothetical protein
MDKIFYKEVDFNKANMFLDHIFKLADVEKMHKLIIKLVEKEKFYILYSNDKTDNFFTHLLRIDNIEILNNFVNKFEKIDHKSILEKNNELFYSDMKYSDILITLLNKNEDHLKIIDLFIENIHQPEKAVSFLENLNISETNKEDLYNYFKIKIKNANYLSSVKKFYFINIFQDNVN